MSVLKNQIVTIKALSRAAMFLLVAASISACGFHLRGNIPLSDSIKNMFVKAPEGTFKDILEETLSKAGAELAPNQGGADVVLDVTKALSDRTVGTIDERGKVDSYDLRLKVVYVLNDPAGETIRKKTTLNDSRRYNFIPEQVVESESEEAELLGSMEQEIALRIVRQLASITDYKPK